MMPLALITLHYVNVPLDRLLNRVSGIQDIRDFTCRWWNLQWWGKYGWVLYGDNWLCSSTAIFGSLVCSTVVSKPLFRTCVRKYRIQNK